MKNLANFLFEAGMLLKTPRSGFQFLGSGDSSVAEHLFRTTVVGFTLARLDPQADSDKVLKLCLFHDLPEARTGDMNYVNKKYVEVDENKAIEELSATLPFGDEYRELLKEFNEGTSREARIARDADQLELILSLRECHDLGNRYAQEWYPYAVKRLQTENARKLATTIWETDSSQWWMDDNENWWIHAKHQKKN
ncbi:MAG: HD domain-containing protein [bacterium]|nr:HD domain-containing protein [bacterium]